MTNRELVYAFVQLPHVTQRELAIDLKLITLNEIFSNDQEFHISVLKRATEANKIPQLVQKIIEVTDPPLSSGVVCRCHEGIFCPLHGKKK